MINDSQKNDATSFDDLELPESLLEGIRALGYETPTPIQAQTIPLLLQGADVIGRARTGSGKTAAFGLPILAQLPRPREGVHALILAPTRELALQVTRALREIGNAHKVSLVTVYGGAPYGPQLRALREGVDIVVGTPGRLLDLLNREALDLSKVSKIVIDEADEMLKMGFIEDVETILKAASGPRQVSLFSATMAAPIRRVAAKYLNDPREVQVESKAMTVDHIQHQWLKAPRPYKLDAISRLLEFEERGSTLIFVRTRENARTLAEALADKGWMADALHGDLSQAAREQVLRKFRYRRLSIVVATDIAARGIDVENVTHVINADFPETLESYVHRVGRTGRAGRKGLALSLVLPAEIRRVERYARTLKVPIEERTPPSDKSIAESKRTRVEAALFETEEQQDGALWLELFEAQGRDLREVATAALQSIATKAKLKLDDGADDSPPSWWRPPRMKRAPAKKDRPAQGSATGPRARGRSGAPERVTQSGETEVFLSMGKRRGLRKIDVVGSFTKGLGLAGKDIGKITIHDNKAFVALPNAVAKALFAKRAKVLLRGVEMILVPARANQGPERVPRNRPKRQKHSFSKKSPRKNMRPGKRNR